MLALALAPAALAQTVYDFETLLGSDTRPFTLLDGQDGWSEQTFASTYRCAVTATLSHDGSKSLRYQESGPGFGCDASRINDANWSFAPFTGQESHAFFQADLMVGYWGGSFGLAHDTNRDGTIRAAQAGERGVRFHVGTQANAQFQLIAADGTFVRVPLSNLGTVAGGHWLRIRVAMDFTAAGGSGLGKVEVQNLTAGATVFTPVPGLLSVPLGLSPSATDATNPTSWDALWLHFEGATYGLDNVRVGADHARAEAYGTGCGNPSLGLRGLAAPVIGTAASAETFAIPSGSAAGFVLIGIGSIEPGIDLTAIGMPGCFLAVAAVGNLAFAPTGATSRHTLTVPNDPTLAGASISLQSAAVAAGTNALGVITSNGLRWVLGVQ